MKLHASMLWLFFWTGISYAQDPICNKNNSVGFQTQDVTFADRYCTNGLGCYFRKCGGPDYPCSTYPNWAKCCNTCPGLACPPDFYTDGCASPPACTGPTNSCCKCNIQYACASGCFDTGGNCLNSCCASGCTDEYGNCQPWSYCDNGGGGGGGGGGWCTNCSTGCCDGMGNCTGCNPSPIAISLGEDYEDAFTDVAGGVMFDIDGDGTPEKISWTKPGAQIGWLSFPSGDNLVNDGKELFGTFTPQLLPDGKKRFGKNGFNALRGFGDRNKDGVFSAQDGDIWNHMRLWIDTNRNGISEPDELHTLASKGILSISLEYQEIGKKDKNGNEFRFQGTIMVSGRPNPVRVYDVILQKGAN